MKKYRVTADCYTFFRYWEKGEIAELGDDVAPPHLFEPYAGNAPAVEVPAEEPRTMSEMNQVAKESAPKTGMAYKKPEAPATETKEPARRGRPPKAR